MELRRIRADEGLAYRDVRLRALLTAPEAFYAPWDQEATWPESRWHDLAETTAEAMEQAMFVIDRGDGAFGGTVFVRVNETPPHDAFVGAMWVDEDLRGEGWAERLLGIAEHYAYRLGSQATELWVVETNTEGRGFYEANGYIDTGIRDRLVQSLNPLVPHDRIAFLYRKLGLV